MASASTSPLASPALGTDSPANVSTTSTSHALDETRGDSEASGLSSPADVRGPSTTAIPLSAIKGYNSSATNSEGASLEPSIDLGAVEEWDELAKQLNSPTPKLDGWLSSQPARVQDIFAHKGNAERLVTAYRLIKLRKMERQQRVLHTPAGRSSFSFEEKLRRFNSIELLEELGLDESADGDA